VLACAAAALTLATAWIRVGPLPQDLLEPAGVSTIVYDRSGEILYEARAGDGSRAMRLSAASLPQAMADATVAAEDRRFWWHPGVDPIALVRAAVRNLRARAVVEGGSTITQQTVKLLLAGSEGTMPRRSVRAKLREAVFALRLEHRLTKREILALYLNTASYGNQLTGAERASHAYFGAGTAVLTPAQAAFLAGLPQRPTTFNPYRDLSRARRRQERVIVQMGVQRLLSPEQVREALDERLTLVREPAAFVAPHFVQRVLAQAWRPGQDGQEEEQGRLSEIHTTLDADLQRIVQGIIRAERPALNRIGAHNVAVVVLANDSAEWLAWEGSGDYGDQRNGGTIDGASTPRQPGSALKPFTYAAAFEDGATPASVLPDVPSFFPTAKDGVLYAPRNYDNQFRGPLLARRALAGSENVPAVALASRVGVPTLLRLLRGAGLTTFDKNAAYYGLGLTLGDAEVRLDELVAAYSIFARGGVFVRPRLIRSSAGRCSVSKCNGGRDSETAFLASSSPDPLPGTSSPDPVSGGDSAVSERLVSPRTAFWITDILSDNEARAYVFGRGGSLEFPFPVAAKTGTSQAYHDNWAIGYTREVTVGVWVGNFDRRPLTGSSGVAGAGPIFHAVMVAATDATRKSEVGTSKYAISNEKQTICALSGMRASAWCPTQTEEWTAGDSSTGNQECTWHVPRSGGVAVKWPQEYVAWARTHGVYDRVTPLPTRASDLVVQAPRVARTPVVIAALAPAAVRASAPALRVVSPPDGAVYLIDPTLRRDFQTLALRAAAAEPADVEWRVDGRAVGRGAAEASIDWPLTAGAHVVTARDANGREASAAIVVK
jgi:penicillin-binding protein 1C